MTILQYFAVISQAGRGRDQRFALVVLPLPRMPWSCPLLQDLSVPAGVAIWGWGTFETWGGVAGMYPQKGIDNF